MKSILFVFSNKTHFETAIPILQQFQEEFMFLAIFDLSNQRYSSGLENFIVEYDEYFSNTLIIDKQNSSLKKISNLLAIKKQVNYWIKTYYIQSSIQYIEGGNLDWLVIGLLKKNNIKTLVIQWAITWEPKFYDELHSHHFLLPKLKKNVFHVMKKMLGLNFPTMKYLGDGSADCILTMGQYWTKQFIRHHNSPDKFITTGNPRFIPLRTAYSKKKKDSILFITGAGSLLYNYKRDNHLRDVKEVYEAYRNSNNTKPLLHKVHPRDLFVEDIFQLASNYQNIKVVTNKSIELLLEIAYATIVIRSTVGLEALVSGSKLIVYNNNKQSIGFNYAHLNLATEVQTISELAYLLSNDYHIPYASIEKIDYVIQTKDVMSRIENAIKSTL